MEKEQLDSLPTVAVGSEKIPPSPHSHYAPSEVYSTSESPPAYTRPTMKNTAVQIARIIAMTLIAISVIIGSFILAAAWLQARASCTPESLTTMQSQMNNQQGEFFKHLQPEALVQESSLDNKEALPNFGVDSTSTVKQMSSNIKDVKIEKDNKDNFKSTNDGGNDNDNDDDYNDLDFPGVHIKFPLQLDLDDLASTLMQQSHGLVSCVVERRRADEYSDENNDQLDPNNNNNNNNNNNENPRNQRLNSERVVILCKSGEPKRQEQQQEPEMLGPIIVPLGNIPIPMRPQEQEYHRYQIQNQYSMPDLHHTSFVNAHRINPLEIQNNVLPEIRNLQQIMEMDSSRILTPNNHPQMELRPIPIELRPVSIEMIRGMKPPTNQVGQQSSPSISLQESTGPLYSQENQQTQEMVPPPPPPPMPSNVIQGSIQNEPRNLPQVMIHRQFEQKIPQPQQPLEKSEFPFPGFPLDILRIIKQVPLKIQSIMQRIDEGMRSEQSLGGVRNEQIQDFKPFPINARPIQINPSTLPIEVKNLLEHGTIDGLSQDDQIKSISNLDNEEEKTEEDNKKFIISPEKNILQRMFENREGRDMPHSQITMSFIRPIESFEVPIGVNTRIMDASDEQDEKEHIQTKQVPSQEPQTDIITQQDKQDEANRPHYVQPRSVDSMSNVLPHLRKERIR